MNKQGKLAPRSRHLRPVLAPLVALALLGAGAQARAQQPARLGLLLEAHLAAGGDSIDTLYYSNGETRKLPAGNGLGVAVGGRLRFAGSPVELVATVGYKTWAVAASNARPELSRTTFNLRGDYHLPHGFWVGAGPTWHTNIQYDSDHSGFDQQFDNALGFTVAGGWRYLMLSITQIDYRNQFHETSNASSISAGVIGRF